MNETIGSWAKNKEQWKKCTRCNTMRPLSKYRFDKIKGEHEKGCKYCRRDDSVRYKIKTGEYAVQIKLIHDKYSRM